MALNRTLPILLALFLLAVTLALPARADINQALYQPYAMLLDQFLIEKELDNNGLVSAFDYEAAVDSSEARGWVARQREALLGFEPDRLASREEATAFWINAYNFFMLDQILTQSHKGKLVDSVWDYGGRVNPFKDNVFDLEIFRVGGQKYSLNQIEKGILLGDGYQSRGWKDARVHFAVNCASVGCPPLRSRIYTAANVDSLLAENTRRALNTNRHLKVEGNTLYLTELFKWYKGDFEEASGSVQDFITDWAAKPVANQVQATTDVAYISYDWALNRPDHFPEFHN